MSANRRTDFLKVVRPIVPANCKTQRLLNALFEHNLSRPNKPCFPQKLSTGPTLTPQFVELMLVELMWLSCDKQGERGEVPQTVAIR
jgi:hypothetical protein